ncbi:MAG: cellobiose phosphorylase [Dorea sp.]|nr:cellobiose phosphorylase [Dorea sp.]
MKKINFIDKNGSFTIKNPENYSYLYYPIAGDKGLKSAITPDLGGDSKRDQNTFLLEPESSENLHNNRSGRNFFVRVEDKGYWSVCGRSAEQEFTKFTKDQDESEIEAGFMWHILRRKSEKYGLKAEVTSFVPLDGKAEIMMVEVENITDKAVKITPIGAIPIYGRSADNIRDHRHVTSLLHRIEVKPWGTLVKPTLSFDERGHQKNQITYFVAGSDEKGNLPVALYPTVEEFLGEGGTFLMPEAVRTEKEGTLVGTKIEGKEAVGAFAFAKILLSAGEKATFLMQAGLAEEGECADQIVERAQTKEQVLALLDEVKEHWTKKVNVDFRTGDDLSDGFLKWICFQPILRRIYGCSFLPYHDYGKGGRGWRDLWQDCLALLIMEPDGVRQMIVDNYGGVRIDGTNATIIGSKQGEFIADRNNITRVWMDHAFWPFVTTKFYIDQTGDIEVLSEQAAYFKDRQCMRGTEHDDIWSLESGNLQKTEAGEVYKGSLLEHILLQNLCAFYDVGDHNTLLLHGADWNDAIDMASKRGESVAFTCAYAGNLRDIADYVEHLAEKTGETRIEIAREIALLLAEDPSVYGLVEGKQEILKKYTALVKHEISGEKMVIEANELGRKLREMSDWMMKHIRTQEWLNEGWFNSYYDDHGCRVEGTFDQEIRMMLTGQVFSVMSGTADEEQIKKICQNADRYLYDQAAGGYRLNTNFHEVKDDLGRMFGFAYGEKENGAVFSHMTVMFANALYRRGFAKEGHKALQTLLDSCMNFERSVMYPGIPEYFNPQGRGMYSYLTGAASWFMMTMINQVYGVAGEMGNLVIAPKLMPSQFSEDGDASLTLVFQGKTFQITYHNPDKVSCDAFVFDQIVSETVQVEKVAGNKVYVEKASIDALADDQICRIDLWMK